MKRLVLKTTHAKATRTNFWSPSGPSASRRSVGHVQSATMAGRTFLRRLALASSLGAGAFAASLLHRPTICEVALAARSSAPAMCAAATPARIIDGKAVAATIRSEVRDAAVELKEKNGVTPGLAVVLVGNRTDSKTYVRMKKRAADECGFFSVDRKFDESVTQNELVETVRALNADPQVHAILVQLPLPKHIDEGAVLEEIAVAKDVDGFSAANIGNMCLRGGRPPLAVPCTPAGCVELLQRSECR